jgi:hypothetical protein
MTTAQLNKLLASGKAKLRGDQPLKERAPRFSGPIAQQKERARLNSWEREYEQLLANQKHVGEIADFWSQSVKLRLADATFYTPDFVVKFNDGRLRFVEIKGFKRDDAMVKFKVAKETYAMLGEWVMLTKTGDGWLMI